MALDNETLGSLRIDRTTAAGDSGPGRKILIWCAVGVAIIAAGVLGYIYFGGTTPEVTTVTAQAESTGPSLGNAVLNASGYVVARRMATASSKITGKVLEIYVEEGMEVKKDQVIARLDPVNVQNQLTLSERQLDAAKRDLAEIEVRLAEAQRNLERNESLIKQQLVSQTALDASRAEMNAFAARLEASKAQVKVSESNVTMRRTDYDDLQVRAPFSGVVISKDAQPGEMISPLSAGGGFTRTGIATIVDMDSREIEVDVNESYINRVKSNQRVEAALDAYPDDPMAAHVINIVPTADKTKATVRVRIAFDKLDPRILPEMGIKVRFLDDQPPPQVSAAAAGSRVTIPSAAVKREGNESYVFIVSDGHVQRRAVTIGAENDGQSEVLAGLSGGEELVAPIVDGLIDGAKVKLKESNS
jgi:RND family efflux transporter MFP subunit